MVTLLAFTVISLPLPRLSTSPRMVVPAALMVRPPDEVWFSSMSRTALMPAPSAFVFALDTPCV